VRSQILFFAFALSLPLAQAFADPAKDAAACALHYASLRGRAKVVADSLRSSRKDLGEVKEEELLPVYRGFAVPPDKFQPGFVDFHNFAKKGEMYVTSSVSDALGYAEEDNPVGTVVEFFYPKNILGTGARANDHSFTQYSFQIKSAKDVSPFISRIGAVVKDEGSEKVVWFKAEDVFKNGRYVKITPAQVKQQMGNPGAVEVLHGEWINNEPTVAPVFQ
jgi:hypothetical protein